MSQFRSSALCKLSPVRTALPRSRFPKILPTTQRAAPSASMYSRRKSSRQIGIWHAIRKHSVPIQRVNFSKWPRLVSFFKRTCYCTQAPSNGCLRVRFRGYLILPHSPLDPHPRRSTHRRLTRRRNRRLHTTEDNIPTLRAHLRFGIPARQLVGASSSRRSLERFCTLPTGERWDNPQGRRRA